MPENGKRASLPLLPSSVVRWYGNPEIVTLPVAAPDEDQSEAWEGVLVKGADVLLFPDVWPGDLDGFFRLRLLQVLLGEAPSPALSVVVLAPELRGRKLAGGFADRFRCGWPFARCVFATVSGDPTALSAQLGVPVGVLEDGEPPPVLRTQAEAGQKIAVQVQMPWGRCGSTTLFENQVESLVREGFLTIRLFCDPGLRRGATLDALLEQVIPENSTHAGAHIDALAVPVGPPVYLPQDDEVQARAIWLANGARCRIADPAIADGVGRADAVIVNDTDAIGAAVGLAADARILLASRDDRIAAARDWLIATGKNEAEVAAGVTAETEALAGLLAIPDVCVHVSPSEMALLGRRNAIVLPRVYTRPVVPAPVARFDVLVVGDGHEANVASVRWFLDAVWRPWLEPAGLLVAVVGRVGQRIDVAAYASASLFFLGFVEDLDRFRGLCRLSVVPDRSGSGVSMKMLTTLAAGHPLVTTQAGLRGLDPAITERLPAHDDAAGFAGDILALLADSALLEARRGLVAQAGQAILVGPTYADVLRCLPRADGAMRRAQWSRVVAAAPADPAPYLFDFAGAFSLSGTERDGSVLGGGWHEAEPWGRWTDGVEASLRVVFAAPVAELLRLELDLNPSPVGARLTLCIDGTKLPVVHPVPGLNVWAIPPALVMGKTGFTLTLLVDEAVCPAALGKSPDTRILGIGVSAVRLRSRQPTVCRLGAYFPINGDAAPREVLVEGWHAPEPWGCWSNGAAGSLRLWLDAPLTRPVQLELDLVATPAEAVLAVFVNGWTFPSAPLRDGTGRWDLPMEATRGKTELLVGLSVSETYCPAAVDGSADDRTLGVGLRGLRLRLADSAVLAIGTALRLGAGSELDDVLLGGWHAVEPWGCWTSLPEAEIRLRFGAPLAGPLRLEIELSLPPVCLVLTVVVNGVSLAAVTPVAGRNDWILPEECVNGRREILLGLRVSGTVCPAELDGSADDRTLGIGVCSVALHRAAVALCSVGVAVRFSSADGGVLLDGWHTPELWGCWSSGRAGSMLLRFGAPLRGGYLLVADLIPPLRDPDVTLEVNGVALSSVYVVEGLNEWVLPRGVTEGQRELRVRFVVERPARPIDVLGGSGDDRVLGVGVKSVRVEGLGLG